MTALALSVPFGAMAADIPRAVSRAITVGADHNYPPFEYVDEEGNPTGFNVELLRAIAETMGLTLEITAGPWKEIRDSLERGTLDMVSGMYYSPERDAKVDFSVPFILVHESMFVRETSPFDEITDLWDREIIVQSGDIMHDYVLGNRITQKIVEVNNTLDGIRLLASGRHDAALLPKLQGQYFLRKYDIANIKAAGPAILDQKYCFAVAEGNTELTAILDQGLGILKASGKYREIREHWFGVLEGTNYRLPYRIVLTVLLCLLLVLSVFWVWTRTLQQHVRRKTRELADELAAHQHTLSRLKDKEAHLRALVESSPDAILVLDKAFCMTDWNPAFEKQFGFRREDILNRSCSLLLPDDARSREIEKNISREIRENGTCQYQHNYRHKSGREVPTETTISEKILPDGGLEGYVAIMRNISKRKQAEKEKEQLENQLRQVHKMEAIGTLAAGIAHDFNNILASIVGYGELARRTLDRKSQACQDIAEVLEAADRAKGLVRQILTYSRRTEQERRPEYLSFLVKGALRLLKASLTANVEIVTDIRMEDDLVLADVTQINQVIINLVTNAAHAIGSCQGTVQVRLRNMELTRDTIAVPPLLPGGYVELTVTDTGHGIDKSIQERIFDPFFTTKQRGEGTGMGLSVVHGIVKDHGGRIQVESRLNQGASFQILLPVYEGSQGEINTPGPIIGGNERILIIDDEKKVINAWKRILTSLGYQVVSSVSPERGLRRFENAPNDVDLVVTDLDMPEMNGQTLIQGLKATRPDIRVIVHTGLRSRQDEQTASQLGVARFLYKPVSTRKMAETLRTVLDPAVSPETLQTRPDI